MMNIILPMKMIILVLSVVQIKVNRDILKGLPPLNCITKCQS